MDDQPTTPPPTYTFFVKTEEALHQGGHVFFSLEQFEQAQPVLEKEATHICESNDHTLVSWGITDPSGHVVKEFKAKG